MTLNEIDNQYQYRHNEVFLTKPLMIECRSIREDAKHKELAMECSISVCELGHVYLYFGSTYIRLNYSDFDEFSRLVNVIRDQMPAKSSEP